MRPTVTVLLALTVAVTTMLGCSSDPDATSTTSAAASAPASTETFCQAYCQKVSDCDSTNDLQTCSEKCDDNVGNVIEKLRADVTTEVRTCFSGSDCRQVLTSDRLSACVEEAAVSAAPNAKAKALCDALGASLTKCDSTLNRAECLDTSKVYSDAALEQATKCTTKSCSAIMHCVNATL